METDFNHDDDEWIKEKKIRKQIKKSFFFNENDVLCQTKLLFMRHLCNVSLIKFFFLFFFNLTLKVVFDIL